jgi:hypothetical protein
VKPGACAVVTPPRPFRVLIVGPGDLGQGGTEAKRAERAYMVGLLVGIREWRPAAVLVHLGAPRGTCAIVDAVWRRQWGLPVEVHRPAWEDCGPACPPGTAHRTVRKPKDEVHGSLPTYCDHADTHALLRLFRYRPPDRCIAVVGKYSRITKTHEALATTAGVLTKRYPLR